MKKNYESPEVEITRFDAEDVMSVSVQADIGIIDDSVVGVAYDELWGENAE